VDERGVGVVDVPVDEVVGDPVQGMPLAWYDVFVQLSSAPERRLRMQALADRVVFSRSGLTRLIDRMESAGVVRREHSESDRRGYYVVLTAAGERSFERARPVHDRVLNELSLRHLDESDVHALGTALSKVSEADRRPRH
jgi:DNA-binding MarR family transcriptional regulator